MFLDQKVSYLTIGALVAFFLAGQLFFNYEEKTAPKAEAAAAHNIFGFAWSENIGWVSFNSLNCDIDGNGFIDTNAMVLGCGGNNTTDQVFDYGVNLDASNNLSGYAWSSNIGWISFQLSDVASCPSGGICQPRLSGSNFFGWARALSYGGGWDGWIKLRKDPTDAGENYGVSLSGADFNGFAWGSDVVGWLSFNCSDTGTCGVGHDYKVYINIPPTVNPLPPILPDYCSAGGVPANIRLSWTATNQNAYELKAVRNDGAVCDSGKVVDGGITSLLWGSDINNISGCAGFIGFAVHTYAWTIEVWNSNNVSSGPQNGIGFDTPAHKYPFVDFSPPPPTSLLINTQIDFTDSSTCYGGSSCTIFAWDFCGGITDPSLQGQGNCANGNRTANGQTVSHNYDVGGVYYIVLGVTDSDGYFCVNPGNSKFLGAKKATWKEVIPAN